MAKTFVALIVSLCLAFPVAAAQIQSKPDTRKSAKPAWSELSPAQQQVLAPLAAEWDQLDTARRKKWVAIADRYPTMKPRAQENLHKRMQEWVKLTPEQRKAARENYQKLRNLPPDKRQEVRTKWQQYQESLTPPVEKPVDPSPPEPVAPAQESAAPANQ